MNTTHDKTIAEEVEKTLHAFDNDPMLKENPYLLTRIQAERDRRLHKKKNGFSLRFGVSQAVLVLIIVINVVTVAYYYEWSAQKSLHEKTVVALTEDCYIDQTTYNF